MKQKYKLRWKIFFQKVKMPQYNDTTKMQMYKKHLISSP